MASSLLLRPCSLSKLRPLLSFFHASQTPHSNPKLGLGLGLGQRQSHPQLRKPQFFCTSAPFPVNFDPKSIYPNLAKLDVDSHAILPKREWESLAAILRFFTNSPWTSDQSLAIYVPSSFFPTAAKNFRRFLLRRCSLPLFHHLAALPGPNEFLLPVFFDYCLDTFREELKRFKTLMETADLTKPHTWFPFARAMKRKIVYHCGPTNSGKTYNALQRFMKAKNGVYCGPLRLLAMEVFDKVNSLGVYCSLLTGQEKKTFPFLRHVACTIEMVSTEELYEVAVINEVQMTTDLTRGYAWTRALLGLKGYEIHVGEGKGFVP